MHVSPLGVVVRIQLLSKLLQQRTTRALKRHGLKHWEYDVLSMLRRQGEPFELPSADIAESALLSTGATTARIDGLEGRGLVSRRRSSSDRRSILVKLTAEGRTIVDAAIESRLEDASDALSMIPIEEQRRLAASLRMLLLAMEPKR